MGAGESGTKDCKNEVMPALAISFWRMQAVFDLYCS